MSVEPVKIFECSCVDGFTGDFCEFKTEQNQLLFISDYDYSFFGDQGQRIEKKFTFDNNANAYGSCFTMLNGEALIFGGYLHPKTIQRQVTNSNWFCFIFVNFLDFCCLRVCIETTW